MKSPLACLLTLSLALAAMPVRADIVIYPTNNGFELPDFPGPDQNGSYVYSPTGSGLGWTFHSGGPGQGGAGVAANGSAFGVSAANQPNLDGPSPFTSTYGQAAFIQNGNGSMTDGVAGRDASFISQDFSLPGGGYNTVSISFWLEARGDPFGFGFNPISVWIDGVDVGVAGTTYQAGSASAFSQFTTDSIFLADGLHTLAFIGTNPLGGDRTQFLDGVVITAIPEPSTFALLGLAASILGWRSVRSRRKSVAPA